MIKTVIKSLYLSCRSELTRQGASLLRTVIVTAAVYWSLSKKLILADFILYFWLTSTGRLQPIYLTFQFCMDLCLDKQSLNNLLLWPDVTRVGHLQKVTPAYCRFLDHLSLVRLSLLDQPPVSDVGTVKIHFSWINSELMEYFSEAESYQIGLLRKLFIIAQVSGRTYYHFILFCYLNQACLAWLFLLLHSLRICTFCSRISTTCHRVTPHKENTLRTTNLRWFTLRRKPWFTAAGFSPDTRYSYRHSHF